MLDVPDDQLRCLSFGHAWERYVPVAKRGPSFGYRVSLRCGSCRMERHDIIDVLGRVASRQYVKPDGYAAPLPRADYRVELLRRRT